jgi:hypothetical protein
VIQTKDLPQMVDVFFPSPTMTSQYQKSSVWEPFIKKGYIQEYHHILGSMYDDSRKQLRRALICIFESLQCLPPSLPATKTGKGKIWDSTRGSVRFLTNPAYYRLEAIGVATQKPQKAVKVKAHASIIAARLAEEHDGVPVKATAREKRMSRLLERAQAQAEARAAKRLARAHQQKPKPQSKEIPWALDMDDSQSYQNPSPSTDRSFKPSHSPASPTRIPGVILTMGRGRKHKNIQPNPPKVIKKAGQSGC